VVGSCALLGAACGLLTAWPAYRLSVDFGEPPLSACGSCGANITTWVRAARRCHSCGARLAVSWVWTAIAGVLSFGLLAWAIPVSFLLLTCLVLAGLGLLLAVIDLRVLRLPDPLVLAGFIATAILLALDAWTAGAWPSFGRAWLGGAAMFCAYLLFALLPGAPMGFGDVKLAGVLGLVLGYLGWPAVVFGMLLPFLVNGPFAAVALIRRGRKAVSPFGPALLIGALVSIVILGAASF
jgi:leader peptidase (prepilin peptidase)/N-methyltransferase